MNFLLILHSLSRQYMKQHLNSWMSHIWTPDWRYNCLHVITLTYVVTWGICHGWLLRFLSCQHFLLHYSNKKQTDNNKTPKCNICIIHVKLLLLSRKTSMYTSMNKYNKEPEEWVQYGVCPWLSICFKAQAWSLAELGLRTVRVLQQHNGLIVHLALRATYRQNVFVVSQYHSHSHTEQVCFCHLLEQHLDPVTFSFGTHSVRTMSLLLQSKY